MDSQNIDNQNMHNNQNLMNCCRGKKGMFAALVVFLIIFLAAASISAMAGALGKLKQLKLTDGNRTVIFTDTGEVYAKPDLAIIDLSVVTEAKTVADAMTQNTNKMNAVINFVKSQGVDQKDLKTTNFSIYPQYSYVRAAPMMYPEPDGIQVLTGYNVTQTLEVKIRDLSKTGVIIEGATAAGANQIGNLQFTIDNEDQLKEQARSQAIKKIKARAGELSKELGVNIKKIINFSENAYGPIFYASDKALEMGGGTPSAPIPQTQTGENKISVTVTVTYEIN